MYIRCTVNIAEITNGEVIVALLDDFQTAIGNLPGIELESVKSDVYLANRQFDLVVTARIKGERASLVIEAKSSGYPRDVMNAAWQLAALREESWPHPLVPVVAAPSISKSSRSILKDEKIGYWDSGGSLFLELPWALYWIDRPAPRMERHNRIDIFRGRATQVLHAMLLRPETRWHVQELADHAEVSKSTAHQVLVNLEDQLWVEKQGRGPKAVRQLIEPGALLNAWAERYSLEEYQRLRFHRWTRCRSDLIETIARACEQLDSDYAFTLATGARFVAPYATDPGRVTLLVPESLPLTDFSLAAELKPVEEGENVLLFRTKQTNPLMFRQRADEFWIASNIQLYLDLWAWPQRGKEQAQHLRLERIGF